MDSANKEKVATGLSKLLADTFTLYLKTHKFHWNVKGPFFQMFHGLFGSQYEEMWEAVDEIAERIRQLGLQAPGSYKEYMSLTTIQESIDSPRAEAMLVQLVADQNSIIKTCEDLFTLASEAGDQATADLLIQRMKAHEKQVWMLRSHLE